MKRILVSLALVLGVAMPLTARGEQGKVDPARLRGMKEAALDLEKGYLKIKQFPIQIGQMVAPTWYAGYVSLLKKECGIDLVDVDETRFPPPPRADMDGYNAIMLLEIEYRFGQGILDKLRAKAQANVARLRAMKEALSDIDNGHLNLKWFDPAFALAHDPPWFDTYRLLIKKECGVEIVWVGPNTEGDTHAYNDVMVLEIEYRFGKGILDRLGKKARDGHATVKVCE